jgi:hypothetical protein
MNDGFFAKNSRLWILAVCLFVPAWSVALQAQSSSATYFLFPHFVSSQGEATGIIIFNPNSQAATVTLAYRNRDGQMPEVIVDPAIYTIPARGLLSTTADQLFGTQTDLDGSLEITSSVSGLVAHALTYDPSMTFLEGMESAEASMSMVFPVTPSPAEGASQIDLTNPNLRETSVELKLWSMDGKVLGIATVRVPGGGVYRNLVQNIFPAGVNFAYASHITAVSKQRNVLSVAQSVAGISSVAGFSAKATSYGYVDLATLNAVPVTQVSNAGVIPHFHIGGQYASTLALVNLEPAAMSVTVTAIANNGSTLGVRTVAIPGQGGFRAPLSGMIPELGSDSREGWLLIQSTGRILGCVLYGRSDAPSLAAEPLQKTPKAEFVFPEVFQGDGLLTEIALVNPTPVTGTAEVQVVGYNGSTLAATRIDLGPSKRLATSLKQLFPELSEPWSGVLHVRSSAGLFATATLWSDTGGLASNMAPQDTAFTPSPLTSFSITGKVTFNDKPAAGFKVALSGTASKSATTDESGSYGFANLSKGSYTVAIAQAGFQFVPAQATIELTTASVRQDFQGFTATDAILVQPDALPTGSPNTKISIFGRDFIPTSEAFVGSLRLTTTFVDSTQLQAIMPSYLTATASRFQIVVVTNGSDASRRVSQPYPFVAYQDKPVLIAISAGGNIVEGSPGTTLSMQGTGFLEGIKIRVNGISDGIQVTVVSSTQILAYVPASYLEQAGIYPVSVENPYPANAVSSIQLLTVYYVPPAIEAILPGVCSVRLETDASPLSLEIIGYGFRRGAVVLMEGKPLMTTYCETDAYCLDTHLYAKIPANMLVKAGFVKIEVKNPDPSLALSEATYLRIEGLQPTITAVQPGSATLVSAGPDFTMPLIIDGTNFGPDTFMMLGQTGSDKDPVDGKAKVLSTTRLLGSMTVKYPDSLGEWWVVVCNAAPGGGCSDPVTFAISETTFVAAPFLTSLSPGTVAPGSRSFTLMVNGSNFKPGAVINFRTTALVTTVVSKNQVRAVVPSSLIRTAGKVPISVTNPDNGGTSNKLFFDIK